jgi:hypothetical protein
MNKLLLMTIFLSITILQINAQTIISQEVTQNDKSDISSQKSVSQNTKTTLPLNKQQNTYVRPKANERFKRYLNNTVGIGLIGVGFGAAFQQIENVPPEWGKTGKGFARRFGSTFGENAIQETVAYGLEEALKLDSKFYKSQKRNLTARLKNAFLSSVTAFTPSGRRVFNPSRIIGAYTANFVSTATWYPKRYGYKDGFRQGSQAVGFNIGFGFINEFFFK